MYKLALATDLDGTFLEGDLAVKKYFYNKVLELRNELLLIYVTGRPIFSVKELCKKGHLPTPHFVIGDHGTHIVEGVDFKEIDPLQNPIIKKWNDSNAKIEALLQHEVGIQRQPLDTPYRVAYYYHPVHIQKNTLDKITQAGFDVIQSSDMYLDIVPKGVGKGSSLLQLLDHLKIPQNIAITSGDSMNDLSLFQTGLRGIAVGNSEPKLIKEIQSLDNVFHSNLPGIHGIIEGLNFFMKDSL